ncbi:macro domain-containing protein [Companilactobacillus paralimentarius]|uniref:macro domain-containing protein n=1 Tax=Companilactobacillus paralimentarius TaxID=83526 RepID=UPI00221FD783
MSKVTVIKADIANLPFRVGGIVNAANSALIPGGGVDGALNAKAGSSLKKICWLLKALLPEQRFIQELII